MESGFRWVCSMFKIKIPRRIKIPGTPYVFAWEILNLNKIVIGLQSTSFTSNGYHILMLDYDDLPYRKLLLDCKKLQEKYDLPNMRIYRSSYKDGVARHNVMCFTPLTFEEMATIMSESKADINFKKITLSNKVATLRITKKHGIDSVPTLVNVLKRKSKTRKELKYAIHIFENILEQERELCQSKQH